MGSIFEGIPGALPEEFFETLCTAEHVSIERIVSRGHASPEDFWYDQKKNEFVLLVKGSAGLKFKNEKEVRILNPGDYCLIEAHVKHRVAWTDPDCDTVWVAIHYD